MIEKRFDWNESSKYCWKSNFPTPGKELDISDLEKVIDQIAPGSKPKPVPCEVNDGSHQPYATQYEQFTSQLLDELEARLINTPASSILELTGIVENDKYKLEVGFKKTSDNNYGLTYLSVTDKYLEKRWTQNSDEAVENIQLLVETGVNSSGMFDVNVTGRSASIRSKENGQYENSFTSREIVKVVDVITHAMYENYRPEIATPPSVAKRSKSSL